MVLLFGSDDAHWADLERHQVDDLVQEWDGYVAQCERTAAHDQEKTVRGQREGAWNLTHQIFLAVPLFVTGTQITLVSVMKGETEGVVDDGEDAQGFDWQWSDWVISQLEVISRVFLGDDDFSNGAHCL